MPVHEILMLLSEAVLILTLPLWRTLVLLQQPPLLLPPRFPLLLLFLLLLLLLPLLLQHCLADGVCSKAMKAMYGATRYLV